MRKGFTLIEMLVVAAMVLILGALAIVPVLKIMQGRSEVPINSTPTDTMGFKVTLENRGTAIPTIDGTIHGVKIVNGYEISVAFEYDGVRVYRFFDDRANRFYYFSKEIR